MHETHKYVRLLPGSDLWPVTWGPDGHIYTSWGDGGGLDGTNSDWRVSMGFARIEGPPEKYVAININGGKNGRHPASLPHKGKTGGIVFVDGSFHTMVNICRIILKDAFSSYLQNRT